MRKAWSSVGSGSGSGHCGAREAIKSGLAVSLVGYSANCDWSIVKIQACDWLINITSTPALETFSDCHATPENVNFFFMIS